MEECIICFDETTEFMFYRCAHKVCTKCYPKIKTCPMCNTPSEVIVVQPVRIVAAPEIHTTYNIIRCLGIVLILGAFSLFFYNNK